MAYEENVRTATFEAGGDLSAAQYKFVALAADGQVDVAGDGVDSVGVLYTTASVAGRAVAVAYEGIAKVIAGGVLEEGERVTVDGSGRAVATVAENEFVVGIAKEPAGAAGQVTSILLMIPGVMDVNQA